MRFQNLFLKSKDGIKFSLKDLKDDIKREDYKNNPKLQAIFDFFDIDNKKDGMLSSLNKNAENELQSIFEYINSADMDENGVLDKAEADHFIQKLLPNKNITSDDLFLFLSSLINKDDGEKVQISKQEKDFKYTVILNKDAKDEGRLEWDGDSLLKIRAKYPDAHTPYLKDGVVTILDKNGNPVADENGNPLKIDYIPKEKVFSEELAEIFVLGHKASPMERILHQAEIQKELDRLNSLPPTEESYTDIMRSIAFEQMSKKEQTEALLKWTGEKFYDAVENKDYMKAKEYLMQGFGLVFQKMDMASIGNTNISVEGFKDFLKTWSGLDFAVEQLDQLIDDGDKENLTRAEKVWAFTKGVGDAVDHFVGTQGVAFMGTLALAGEAATAGGIGEIWAVATQAYFGWEGMDSAATGLAQLSQADSEEEYRMAGDMVGTGAIMVHGAYKSFKGALTGKLQAGLEVQKAIKEIRKTKSLDEIKELQDNLSDLPYTEQEIQAIATECLKQANKLLSESKEDKVTTETGNIEKAPEFIMPEKNAALTPELDAQMERIAANIEEDLELINSSRTEVLIAKGYENSCQGFDGASYIAFNKDGFYCNVRYDEQTGKPVSMSVYSFDNNCENYYKISQEGKKSRISEQEYKKLEAEYTGRSFSEDIQRLLEFMQNQYTLTELVQKMNELNIRYEAYEDGSIMIVDENRERHTIFYNSDGKILGFNNDMHKCLYDSSGKAKEVTKEKYFDVKNSRKTYADKKYENLKEVLNSKSDLRIFNLLNKYDLKSSRYTDCTRSLLDDLIKNEDDIQIFEYLYSKQDEFNSNYGYEYNITDIINILKSDKAKDFVLKRIKKNQSFTKTDIEWYTKENVISKPYTTKLSETQKQPEKIEDITLKSENGEVLSEENIIEKFNSDAEFRARIPAGEVANINGKMYCNDGEKLIPIKLSKEKFEELFPPSMRYKMNQVGLGDCYLVSAIGGLMDSPRGRARMYSMFSQEGNDIVVTFPNTKKPITFKNGKLNKLAPFTIYKKNSHRKGIIRYALGTGLDRIIASQGIKIFEQACAIHLCDGYEKIDNKTINDIFFMSQQMHELDGGWSANALQEILGRDCHVDNVYNTKDYIPMLKEFINDPNAIITFGTKKGSNNSAYDLHGNHAYRIASFDENTGMVGIINPWHCNKVRHIPIYELMNYIGHFEITTVL